MSQPSMNNVSVDPVMDRMAQARRLMESGRAEEGYTQMCRIAETAPDHRYVQLNRWTHLSYVPGHTRRQLYDGFCGWSRRFLPAPPKVPRRRRRLGRWRIGYLSADFGRHSVAYSLEPILESHDRETVACYGYATLERNDGVTRRLVGHLEGYCSLAGLGLEAALERIRRDDLDVLVLVAGNSAGNTTELMAWQPAPIGVDLGSVTTSGLPQIQYRLTDEILDPADSQPFYTERLLPLPGGFVIFRPPEISPPVEEQPARCHGRPTFGSFNQAIKINQRTLDLWAAVLRAVPDADFLIKCSQVADPDVQDRLTEALEQRGIRRQRLRFQGRVDYFEHLRTLGSVDLALDTFPFNGAITTLEALWMGVPTLTYSGSTYVSRVGRDIMTRVGLEIFASDDETTWTQKAVSFARQTDELATLRRQLRERMLGSGLCRPRRFTQAWEQTLLSLASRHFEEIP